MVAATLTSGTVTGWRKSSLSLHYSRALPMVNGHLVARHAELGG